MLSGQYETVSGFNIFGMATLIVDVSRLWRMLDRISRILSEGGSSAHDIHGRQRVVPMRLVRRARGLPLEGGRGGGGLGTRGFTLRAVLTLRAWRLLSRWR